MVKELHKGGALRVIESQQLTIQKCRNRNQNILCTQQNPAPSGTAVFDFVERIAAM
jgi:hypothetical protein